MAQEELAEAMGVSRQTISNWETGAVLPPMGKLDRLSRELEIPLAELLGVEASQQPEANEPEEAVPVVPEPTPRRWPMAVMCAGIACALLIGIAALIGVHSINEKLEPVDTAVPMEEVEGEGEDNFSILEPGTLQPLQP